MRLYVKAKKEISNISSILDKQIGLSDKQLLEIERDEVYMKRLLISQTNTELARLDELMKAENDVLDAILDYNKQKKQFEIDIKKQKEKIIKKYQKYKELREVLERNFNISEVDLEIKLEFKQKNLYDEFSYINGQGSSKVKFIEKLQTNFEIETKHIFEQNDLRFNNNKTIRDLIENFFSTHFYEYDFKIVYQNDEFKQMSPGEKSVCNFKINPRVF